MIKREELYQDRIHRLFPRENSQMKLVGNHVYNITFQVTEDCNLRCTYCYQHAKTPTKMSFETGKKFIDLILASDERSEKYIKSKECEGVIIDFIGGEPFLEIELISELSDYFIQRTIELDHPWANRFRFSICSNGVLYFEPKVQEYIRRHSNHLSLSITIDGNKEQHDACRIDLNGNGSYDRAMAAAEHYAKTYGGRPGTKVTISPYNIDYCGQAIKDYVDAGESVINANCVYEEGWTTEHATKLYNELKDVADYLLEDGKYKNHYISILDWEAGKPYGSKVGPWCGGSGLMIALDPRGDIYPCLRYAPSSMGDKQKPLKIGDVENGFVFNDEQERLIESFKQVTRCMQCEKTEHCSDCPIAMGCGDCAAYSYETYGEVGRRTTFHCDMHKARVLAQTYYKNKRAKLDSDYAPWPMNCPKDWAVPIIGEDEYNMLCELAR